MSGHGLRRLLRRTELALLAAAGLRGLLLGVAILGAFDLLEWSLGAGCGLASVVLTILLARSHRTAPCLARLFERRAGMRDNELTNAWWLQVQPRGSEALRQRVLRRGDELAAALQPFSLVDRRSLLLCAVPAAAMLAWSALRFAASEPQPRLLEARLSIAQEPASPMRGQELRGQEQSPATIAVRANVPLRGAVLEMTQDGATVLRVELRPDRADPRRASGDFALPLADRYSLRLLPASGGETGSLVAGPITPTGRPSLAQSPRGAGEEGGGQGQGESRGQGPGSPTPDAAVAQGTATDTLDPAADIQSEAASLAGVPPAYRAAAAAYFRRLASDTPP